MESMLPERYRRLWKRRLRRQPLLPFWLAVLLVVNLAITRLDTLLDDHSVIALFVMGIVIGQISLLGLWIASRRTGVLSRLLLAIAATAAITLAFALGTSEAPQFAAFDATVLAASSILFGVTEGVRFSFRTGLRQRHQVQYTIWGLMVATTVTPLLFLAGRSADWAIFFDSTVAYLLVPELALVVFVYLLSLAIGSSLLFFGALSGFGVALASALLSLGTGTSTIAYYLGVMTSLGGTLVALKVGPSATRRQATPPEAPEDAANARGLPLRGAPPPPEQPPPKSIDLEA